MIHTTTKVFLQICLLTALCGRPALAQADLPVFEQPEDPQQQLRTLDDLVLAKQKALFAARMRGDPAEIDKAQKEFEEIQKQRNRAVRAIENVR